LDAASATLINNTISGNYAQGADGGWNTSGYGGGIYLNVSSTILINNIVIANSAKGSIGSNTAVGVGGGIFIDAFSATLTNNTISKNSVSGGSLNNTKGGGLYIILYENSAFADIYNNIMWENSGVEGADMWLRNDGNYDGIRSTINLFHNNFDQSVPTGINMQIPFFIDPSNLDNLDPLFIDADNSDYHLQAISPCIDAGDNYAPELSETDKDGNMRIFDGNDDGIAVVDMGAYEYGSHPLINPVPDIKANDSDDPIAISPEDTLIVTVSLDPNDVDGEDGDWWLLADTPFGWYHYDVGFDFWIPGFVVTYQGPLFDLIPPFVVLNMSGFSTGTYTFYFGVD
jgi:hypothetical protein